MLYVGTEDTCENETSSASWRTQTRAASQRPVRWKMIRIANEVDVDGTYCDGLALVRALGNLRTSCRRSTLSISSCFVIRRRNLQLHSIH
jgi:hypothetical protein